MCSMSRRVPSTSRNSLVAGGLIAFIGLAAAFPFIFASTGPTVSTKVVQIESFETYHNSPSIMFKQHNFQVDSSKPLSGQAAVRGAYINSGSKDIGPDPTRYDRSHGKNEDMHVSRRIPTARACKPAQATTQHTALYVC